MKSGIIYLAVPYSHRSPAVEEIRFRKINRVVAKFLKTGKTLFSPISMTHPVAVSFGLPGNWEFWRNFDRKFLSVCEEMWVLTLEGWEISKGVSEEIRIARDLGIPIRYLKEEGEFIR